jgi:hypothetical protein
MARRRATRSRRMRGKGAIGDWFKGAANWIKKNKILSRGSTALGEVFPIMKQASKGFQSLGLGRRRRMTYRRHR